MKNLSVQIEKLDDVSLHGEPLHKALKSLSWINKWFGNHSAFIKAIHPVYIEKEKPQSIIDLGCGGGDLILAVAKSLQRRKNKFTITGIDGNANSLSFTKQKCTGFSKINFVYAEILSDEFNIKPCDILIGSHFVYHFSEKRLINFLKKSLPIISTAIIFSKLNRKPIALPLFKFSSFLVPTSKLAKANDMLDIKRLFIKKEWLSILHLAGIGTHRLETVPLLRILLTIFPITKI